DPAQACEVAVLVADVAVVVSGRARLLRLGAGERLAVSCGGHGLLLHFASTSSRSVCALAVCSCAPAVRPVPRVDLKLRSVSEFVTTNTDEKPIAIPARPGFSRPSAATGIS